MKLLLKNKGRSILPEQAVLDASCIRVASVDETVSFILDTHNYTEFDLTRPDFCGIYDCLDPRTVVRGLITGTKNRKIKTAYQTAGGGAGIVDDIALAETVRRGEVVGASEALELAKNVRGATVLDGHRRCKFLLALAHIKQEAASPSEQTLDSFDRSLWRYRQSSWKRVARHLPRLSEGAQAHLDNMDSYGMSEAFLRELDESYPHHANVKEVYGENQAGVYLINHSQRVGLDRNQKAQLLAEDDLDIQFYHESRGAGFADTIRVFESGFENLSRRQLELNMGAFTLRSCAAETVLCNLRPTQVWELTHSTNGLHLTSIRET